MICQLTSLGFPSAILTVIVLPLSINPFPILAIDLVKSIFLCVSLSFRALDSSNIHTGLRARPIIRLCIMPVIRMHRRQVGPLGSPIIPVNWCFDDATRCKAGSSAACKSWSMAS